MRILFLAGSGELGGAERALLDLMAGLRAQVPAWPLTLMVPARGPLQQSAQQLGAIVVVNEYSHALASRGEYPLERGRLAGVATLPRVAVGVARYRRRLRRTIREFQPNVIHSNALKTHLLLAGLQHRISTVWHLHDYISTRPTSTRLLRMAASGCSVAVASSDSAARDARAVLPHRVPVRSVTNGIDLTRFTPEGDHIDLDALSGISPAPRTTLRIGLLATYGLWKGHETFLRALSLLPADADVRGYIIGGPLYRTPGSEVSLSELRSLSTSLGLGERVGFTGHVQAPETALRALDVVVQASTRPESFGLVIAEAMACGKPLVVSAAGGAFDLLDIERHALKHEPGNPASLAHALLRLMRDAGLRSRLGAAAQIKARADFDRDRYVSGLRSVYESVRS
jgi:glycosyltransferase involved in cell wall biosynthesis